MKWFEDIFAKSKLMIISGILGILLFIANDIYNIIDGFYATLPYHTLFAILVILLLIAYKKGDTSCQKALSAALPTSIMVCLWSMLAGSFGSPVEVNFFVAFTQISVTVIATIVFINHLLLQIDHKGDKIIITISQIFLVLGIIDIVAVIVVLIFNGGKIYDFLSWSGVLFIEIMLACLESRIQKYKARRYIGLKNGTWTEEERQKCKKIFKF